MARKPHDSNREPSLLPTLTDRVRGRVGEAERDFDRRSQESTTKNSRLRPTILTDSSAAFTDSSRANREARSLGKVYGEMRGLYRTYRRQTGRPPVPELRSAVQAFRRGRSLKSLVHIASFLDDRKLLSW